MKSKLTEGAIDWSGVYKKYKGQWVAFADDETTVVGYGKTAQTALKKAIANGYQEPILSKMPDELITYIG